jgi:hypothetical protein
MPTQEPTRDYWPNAANFIDFNQKGTGTSVQELSNCALSMNVREKHRANGPRRRFHANRLASGFPVVDAGNPAAQRPTARRSVLRATRSERRASSAGERNHARAEVLIALVRATKEDRG